MFFYTLFTANNSVTQFLVQPVCWSVGRWVGVWFNPGRTRPIVIDTCNKNLKASYLVMNSSFSSFKLVLAKASFLGFGLARTSIII